MRSTPIPVQNESIAEMMSKLQAGEDEGLEILFEQFSSRLIGLASHHIASHIRFRVPPEDVVQSVFMSFIERYRSNRLDIHSAEGIWGLLTVITIRKCADRVVHHRAARRDVRREALLNANTDTSDMSTEFIDRQPSPLEASIIAETLEQLFHGLDPEDREIAELQLNGFSTIEIANQLNRAERTVRRIRERIRNRIFYLVNQNGLAVS